MSDLRTVSRSCMNVALRPGSVSDFGLEIRSTTMEARDCIAIPFQHTIKLQKNGKISIRIGGNSL